MPSISENIHVQIPWNPKPHKGLKYSVTHRNTWWMVASWSLLYNDVMELGTTIKWCGHLLSSFSYSSLPLKEQVCLTFSSKNYSVSYSLSFQSLSLPMCLSKCQMSRYGFQLKPISLHKEYSTKEYSKEWSLAIF